MTQAFVFPGQGSQSLGMLDSYISENYSVVHSICEEASEVLGYDIAKLIATDEPRLSQTVYTQPAMLTVGVIAWRIRQEQNPELQPAFLAGHSLGEYTALVCAKAVSFIDAVKLVAKRGELMQEAVPPGAGAMAAILGLELAQVNEACIGEVQAANINAPGQIVIAGTTKAVEEAMERAKKMGAKRAILLPVSVPSHCMLMRTAAEKFEQYLDAVVWHKPAFKVIHNCDVQAHNDAASICKALQQQLFSPVRWVETIEFFVQQGVTEIVECGPGKVLTGLNKRIAPTVEAGVC